MTRPSGLYLGELTNPADHHRNGETLGIEPDGLTTHGVIVGMTGSGKTGLGMVLLEEALSKGVPTLVLDPKGDMGNLLLTVPELAPPDFAPWVPSGSDATEVATSWASGLADWSIDRAEIAALRSGHRMTVYTPGSTAGVPLDVMGSLAPPTTSDAEVMRDEADALVSGLLGLVGIISDPLSGREHVLMANLIETAWVAGETLDLPTLLMRIVDPPMRKLGIIDVDQYFPKTDRNELMLKLNGLLASPSFATWGHGAPLDIEQLLWSPDGSANAAVIYLAHLSDDERQMVVSRVLSKLVTWMRGQAGSPTLRALVYMDEVFGFVPPSATPPAKKPILTLMKQARAFGIGVVLATQNPVDLDYKAISNAGTWMIGRLQTERDKARLLEGMSSASGAVDIASLDATISGLAKREFLLHTTGGTAPRTFGVRWAMSYLCGPLSKDQLRNLPGQPPGIAESTAPPSPAAPPGTAPASPPPQNAAVADDETPNLPAVADGVLVRFLDPAATWASSIGAVSSGRRLQAAVTVRCALRFDDATAGLDHTETFEAVFIPLGEQVSAGAGIAVDYDDRDLVDLQPPNSVFVLPIAPIATKRFFTDLGTAVKDRLVAERRSSIPANVGLKLYGRPGESVEAFGARCVAAGEDAADADADKIRTRLAKKIDVVQDALAQADQRVEQLGAEQSMSRTSEAMSLGGSVLGALFGGRRRTSAIATAAGKVMTGRSRSQKAGNRLELAMARVEEKTGDLADLESQLAEELADIAAHWQGIAEAVTTLDVPLEKSDVIIEQIALVWVPTA